MIHRQTQQLSRLVDDLLDVSRISTGRVTLRKEPARVSALLERALEIVKPMIDAKEQLLSVDIQCEDLELMLDLVRITQVIGNLLTNASKYTEKRGSINVSVLRDERSLILKVRDTGMGMDGELISHVFELFTRGDHGLARSEGGLGIGLALARKLVELHDGEITATSDGIGKGSEFSIRVPLGAALIPLPAQPEKVCEHGLSKKVLVVDDNVDSATSLAMLLEMWGHSVATAHDGFEALHVADGFGPEIAVLDIGLPGQDGYAVARALRERFAGDGLTLVAMTGYGQEEDRRRSREAGFDLHLTKPIEVSVIEEFLSRKNHAS